MRTARYPQDLPAGAGRTRLMGHATPERGTPRTATGAPAAVRLTAVARLFRGQPALAGVDLDVSRGEVLLVLGPNGAGKSTLLRVLATAIAPSGGKGEVLGFDLLRDRRRIRERVELLGHATRLYPDLTPAEYLRFVGALWRCGRGSAVEQALDRAGLLPLAGERIRTLSQGTRQRVALARALLRRPELLLLDEPYASLDEGARDLVDALAREARAEGRTVVLATHDSLRAARIADRAIRLEAGRMAGEGPQDGGGPR